MLIHKKEFFKTYFFKSMFILIIFLILFFILNKLEFMYYNYQNNLFLNNLISLVYEKYDIEKEEIINLLNGNLYGENILDEYGIDLKTNSLVLKNEILLKVSIIINLIFIVILFLIINIFYKKQIKSKNKELENITYYLENIQRGNYKLDIDKLDDSELSILKSEIYKITVMLKEQALISKKDKLLLKTSLEDLSHQLKTPLTSISIMIDNINNKDLNDKIKSEFIQDMKREILNINFLISSLLKLAKFDANTVIFDNSLFSIENLINNSIKNVSMIADLKKIKFIVSGDLSSSMIGDSKWQIEAITNILKNCLEYSNINSKIEILVENNNLYNKIIIKDFGEGIDKTDLKHLFERFYKGKNSCSDSVGIGLSLSKAIIEKQNGYISCDSKIGIGTTFTIKYFK